MVLYFQLSSGTGRKLPLNGNNNRENTNRQYLPFFSHKKNTSFEKSYGNVNHALRKTGLPVHLFQFRPMYIVPRVYVSVLFLALVIFVLNAMFCFSGNEPVRKPMHAIFDKNGNIPI